MAERDTVNPVNTVYSSWISCSKNKNKQKKTRNGSFTALTELKKQAEFKDAGVWWAEAQLEVEGKKKKTKQNKINSQPSAQICNKKVCTLHEQQGELWVY